MKKKKVLMIIGLVVVVGFVIYMSLVTNTVKTTKVQADKAKLRDIVEMVSASGRIQPQTKVNITSEVNGEIISLLVKEGDFVLKDNLLIVLDTIQLRSDLDQAQYARNEIEARLIGSKSNMDQAKEEYDRQERLFKDKLTSETMFTNAKYAYVSAESAYNAMKAQAQQAEARYEKQLDNLNKAKILAPMSGIITFVDCEEGEIAPAQTAFTQGKTLMTISNLDVFEVEVEVDETEINKIELGQRADIEVDAFIDTLFKGEVVEIGNTAILAGLGSQEQSTNFKVKVIFNDPNVKIRPGMSATVDIITHEEEEAISIPYSAVVVRAYDLDSLVKAREGITEDNNSGTDGVIAAENDEDDVVNEDDDEKPEEIKGVFVIRDGKSLFVPVETGIADQKYIQIKSGIEEGDEIISGPYRTLRTIKDNVAVEVEKRNKKD